MNRINLEVTNKKFIIPFIFLSVLFITCFMINDVSAAEWRVGPDETYDYNSIQQAINNPNTQAHDTITVYPNGTDAYQENVVVNKNNLTLQSNGVVTLNGSNNPNNPIFNIPTEGTQSKVIGFTLTGATNNAAVYIDSANDVTVSNLTINNSMKGVEIVGTSFNIKIESVIIESPLGQGIYINGYTNNLLITGTHANPTTITSTKTGISKAGGARIDGLTIENTDIHNTGGYGIYIYDSTGGYTKNLILKNINISGAGDRGIYILAYQPGSENIEITQTTVTGRNNNGVEIYGRGNINIHNNPSSFSNNIGWGLWIQGYDNPNTTLTNNTITENGNGLYLNGINNLTLPGDNTITDNGGTNYQLANCNNITLENTTFTNTTKAYQTAINALNCNNLLQQNLTVSNNSGTAILVGGTDVILRDITINNSTGTAVEVQGTSYNMLMEHLTINQPTGMGIYINGQVYTNNSNPALKITSNTNGPTTITGTNTGIAKYRGSQVNGLTIENTNINNTNDYGIYIVDSTDWGGWTKNLLIQNVNVSGAGSFGIYISMTTALSENIEITQTTVTGGNGDGIHMSARGGNINIHDNPSSFTQNAGWGLYIYGYDNPNTTLTNNTITENGNGLRLQGINFANIVDNSICNNAGTDFYSTADCEGNVVDNLSLGVNHPTTISFTYDDGISIKGVESAPSNPDGYQNIGKYVDIMAVTGTSWIDVRVHYTGGDVTNIDEDSLRIWRYAGANWSEVPDPNGVNTTDKYVYAVGIDSFSTFAPLAEKIYTIIDVEDAEDIKDETVDLKATLTANGNALAGKRVDFQVDGVNVGYALTNDVGIATLSYHITQEPGSYEIKAIFNEDDYYLGSEDTSQLTVDKTPTSLVVDYVSGSKDETVDLSATLTDGKSNPLNGKVVYFQINGVDVGFANTNDVGIATLSYLITQEPGSYEIKAVFNEDGYYLGTVNYGELKVKQYPPIVTANPITGIYNSDQLVTLSMDQPGTIYYTTNGQDPTKESEVYQNPIPISSTTTLKFVGENNEGTISNIYTEIYTIDKTPPHAWADPKGGLFNVNKTVSLTMDKTGTIYYTTNGEDPTTQSNIYTEPLLVTQTTTLKFMAVDNAGNPSEIYTEIYTIDKTAPNAWANPKGGLFNVNKTVSLTMNKTGTIYYTRNGTTPTTASTKYTGPLSITTTTTLKFIAVDQAGNISPVYTEKYVIDKTPPKVVSTYPKNLSTNQSRTATLYLKFSEKIKTSAYWSKIYVKDLKTRKKVAITKWIKGNILYIKTKYKRASTRSYQVVIPYRAVKDYAGNNLVKTYSYKFKTRK